MQSTAQKGTLIPVKTGGQTILICLTYTVVVVVVVVVVVDVVVVVIIVIICNRCNF